jgi:hypothetical protein
MGCTFVVLESKRQRVAVANQLLEILLREESNNFRDLVTRGESWFFSDHSWDSAWLPEDEEIQTRIRKLILPW